MGRNLKSLRCNLDSAGAAPHPPRALPTQLLRTFKCFVRDLRLFFYKPYQPYQPYQPTSPMLCKIYFLSIMAILEDYLLLHFCISFFLFNSICDVLKWSAIVVFLAVCFFSWHILTICIQPQLPPTLAPCTLRNSALSYHERLFPYYCKLHA